MGLQSGRQRKYITVYACFWKPDGQEQRDRFKPGNEGFIIPTVGVLLVSSQRATQRSVALLEVV